MSKRSFLINRPSQDNAVPSTSNEQQVKKYKFNLSEKLCCGSFGISYKGFDTLTGRTVVVQLLNMERFNDQQKREFVERENLLINQLQHPNLVQTLECFEKDKQIYIINEYCERAELILNQQQVQQRPHKLYEFIQDILLALKHLHSEGIIHRDVKLQNIYYQNKWKLGNFIHSKNMNEIVHDKHRPGPAQYLAPEVMLFNRYSYKSDVWSFGMTLYELLHGKCPFDMKTVKEELRIGQPLRNVYQFTIDNQINDSIQDLLTCMIEVDVKKRFTTEQCISDILRLLGATSPRKAYLQPLLSGKKSRENLTSVSREGSTEQDKRSVGLNPENQRFRQKKYQLNKDVVSRAYFYSEQSDGEQKISQAPSFINKPSLLRIKTLNQDEIISQILNSPKEPSTPTNEKRFSFSKPKQKTVMVIRSIGNSKKNSIHQPDKVSQGLIFKEKDNTWIKQFCDFSRKLMSELYEASESSQKVGSLLQKKSITILVLKSNFLIHKLMLLKISPFENVNRAQYQETRQQFKKHFVRIVESTYFEKVINQDQSFKIHFNLDLEGNPQFFGLLREYISTLLNKFENNDDLTLKLSQLKIIVDGTTSPQNTAINSNQPEWINALLEEV